MVSVQKQVPANLGRLMYHNGEIKVEIYQPNQVRKRWPTGVKIEKSFITDDYYVKSVKDVDSVKLNMTILSELQKVNQAIEKIVNEKGAIDVYHVWDVLQQQTAQHKAAANKVNDAKMIATKSFIKKTESAADDLITAIEKDRYRKPKNYNQIKDHDIHHETREKERRKKFLTALKNYADEEKKVSSALSVGCAFIEYLTEGTEIGTNNLLRHWHILKYMLKNPVAIENVEEKWIKGLLDHLEIGINGRKVNCNTQAWLFGRFQCFWVYAVNSNMVNKRFHWKKFKRKSFKPAFVWLDETKMKQLMKTKFADPNQRDLECARLSLLVMAMTGMRHSDFYRTSPEDVVKERTRHFIHKITKKTKSEYKVEIHPAIFDIVTNSELMKEIKLGASSYLSNCNLNEAIRKMAAEMKWDEPVKLQVDYDEFETKPFHEWINTHSGRHSAVCHWLNNGISHATIRKWTGWKNSKMIDYYVDFLGLNTKDGMSQIKF